MPTRSLGQRAPLLWVTLPLATGIILARQWELTSVSLGGVLAVGLATGAAAVVLVCLGRARAWIWAAAITVAFGCAGIARCHFERRRIVDWDNLPPRELHASVQVDRVFAPSDVRRISGIARIVRAEAAGGELVGQRVYFSATVRPGDPLVARSAVLAVSGVLTALPADPPPNSFDGYLSTSGVNFRLRRTRLLATERPQAAYYRFCDRAAERFNEILGEGIAAKRPALAGLLRAMMLGQTRDLTEEQHTIFMQSGTMHLFAISGLNIGVIAAMLRALLALARTPEWLRFMIGVPLLWLFVDITGAAPSAIRAFAMSAFFQAAYVTHRPAGLLAALVGSAAIVLVLQPLQLFSASFLMSYVIVLALLLLGAPLSESWLEATALWRDLPKATWARWQKPIDYVWRQLVAGVAIGVATSLVGMITSVEYFQLLTPGALVSNLVLIPSAVIVTIAGFASVLAGLLCLTPAVVICNHAAAIVLLVIETFVRWSVQVPGAFVAAQFRAPWIGGAALCALTITLLAGYSFGWRRERGGWWPPFAVVAVVLVAGVTLG